MTTESGDQIDLAKIESLIEERLASQLTGLQQAISKEMATQITGLGGRIKKDLTGDLSSQIQTQLGEISEQLKSQSPSQDPPSGTPQGQPTDPPQDLTKVIEEQVRKATAAERSQYQQQLESQAEQIKALQEATEKSQESEAKARQEAALARIQSKFAEQTGDSIINPSRFFQYLKEVDGSLEIDLDDQEAYFKTGKSDTFGNPIKVKASDYVPELLKKEEYMHWAKPRPGSGSGEQPGGVSGGNQSKYFGPGSNVSANDLVQMLKQGKGDELMQDLVKAENG